MRKQFAYIFDGAPTASSLPGVEMHTIEGPFELFGLKIIPVPANHGPTSVLGFRFGNAAYLTDFSSVPEKSKELLRGLDDFILDALRYTPHPMHSNVQQSLALVERTEAKTRVVHPYLPRSRSRSSERETARRSAIVLRRPEVRGASLMLPDELKHRMRLAPTLRLDIAYSAEGWIERFGDSRKRTVVTIGNFDGVHLGHQKILSGVVERARANDLESAVLTFYPHPACVLRPDAAPSSADDSRTAPRSIRRHGHQCLRLVLQFDAELAKISAEDFAKIFLDGYSARQDRYWSAKTFASATAKVAM